MSRSRRPSKVPRPREPGCLICDPAAREQVAREKREQADIRHLREAIEDTAPPISVEQTGKVEP